MLGPWKTSRIYLQARGEDAVCIGIAQANHRLLLTLILKVRPSPSSPPIDKDRLTRTELESYARKLIIKSNPNTLAAEINNLQLSLGRLGANEDELEAANMSCRDAVEVVTRHSKKGTPKILCTFDVGLTRYFALVSYDIAKDGKTVAIITFVKGAYRLGETVLGVIELNNPAMDGQVLKASKCPAVPFHG